MARLVEIGVRFNQHIAEVNDVLRRRRGRPRRPPRRVQRRARPRRRRRATGSRWRTPTSCRSSRTPADRDRRQELSRAVQQPRRRHQHGRSSPRRSRCASGSPSCSGSPRGPTTRWTRRWPTTPRRSTRSTTTSSPALTQEGDDEIAVMAARLGRRRRRRRAAAVGLALLRHPAAQDRVRRRPPRGRRLLPARAGARRAARDHRRGVRARVPRARRRAGVAPRRAQLRDRRPAPAARTSPSSTWTSSPRGQVQPRRRVPLVPGRRLADGTLPARRCRRSSPTSPSRPRPARRCCSTTRS